MNDEERTRLEDAARDYAGQLGFDYYDSRIDVDITPLVGKLTVEGMEAYGIVPLDYRDGNLVLGVSPETNRSLLEPLRSRLGAFTVAYVMVSSFGWKRLLNRYRIAANQGVLDSGDYSRFERVIGTIEPKFMFEPVVQLAYQLGASDIHVEPGSETARIRFRLDGTLHPITVIPKDRYELFVSDLQMRAGVKWGSDSPQGGRLNARAINADGDEIDVNMRLETIPSLHGQDVVIRLFNLSVKYLNIENLQLSEAHEAALLKAVSRPRGMVLTVGPTGSGKTSTLYSVINHLNNPESKVVTLEDPVEYELEGISQIPVKSDNEQLFMEKLRAVLREDPNIIMIGEIRDTDTAKTALQAALTGHLVLSTFHASSAAAAIVRLMDMIGQNPLLASSISLIMAQRLVRRLCVDCKKQVTATKQQKLEIKTALHELTTTDQPDYDNLKLYQPVGCDQCHGIGYRGRVGIIEQLPVNVKMQEMITRGTSATTAQALEQAAVADGMRTLLVDGVLKAVAGITTLDEVYAAVGD